MRKIIVYIAVSADGYIARPDGDVAWLNRPAVRGSYGFKAFTRSVDTVLWGRKTHDVSRRLGMSSVPGKVNYVFSRRATRDLGPDVERVAADVADFARRLRRRKGRDIWLMGGAELIASFLDAGQIDELLVFVIPVLIGEGIPLIAPRHRDVPLRLRGTKRYSDGVVRLHYDLPGRRRRSGSR